MSTPDLTHSYTGRYTCMHVYTHRHTVHTLYSELRTLWQMQVDKYLSAGVTGRSIIVPAQFLSPRTSRATHPHSWHTDSSTALWSVIRKCKMKPK